MLTLGIETIVVLLIIMGAVCAVGGYTYAQARQRHSSVSPSLSMVRRSWRFSIFDFRFSIFD